MAEPDAKWSSNSYRILRINMSAKGPPEATFVVDETVVSFHEGLVYSKSNLQGRQNLDLFEPVNAVATKLPLVVYIHGGAWTERDKRQYRHIGDFFVRKGFCCAVINYRLSQGSYDIPDELQVKHPDHTLDCGLALCWLGEHADQYKYSSEHIYIVGHSAGAFMASLLVLQPDTFLPGKVPHMTIRGVIGVEGIYDLNQMLKDYPNYLQWVVAPAFEGGAVEFAIASPTSVIQHHPKSIHSKFPRFLIVHAENDELVNVPQSESFVHALHHHWGPRDRAHLFITEHPNAFHNTVVDGIEEGFDIIAPEILRFIAQVNKL